MQKNQIIPKHRYPHITTVINDYTEVLPDNFNDVVSEPVVRYFFPVRCGQGIDNKIIEVKTQKDAVRIFGDSNFALYGQPYMQALKVLENSNAVVNMIRVMPTNATYAHNVVNLAYKTDLEKKQFNIKLVQNHSTSIAENPSTSDLQITSDGELASFAKSTLPEVETDWAVSEGFWQRGIEYYTKRFDNIVAKINDIYGIDNIDSAYLSSAEAAVEYDTEMAKKADHTKTTAIIMSLNSEGKMVPVAVDRDKLIIADIIITDGTKTIADVFSITGETVSIAKEDGSLVEVPSTNASEAYFVLKTADENGVVFYTVYKYQKSGADDGTYAFVEVPPMSMFTTPYSEKTDEMTDMGLYDGSTPEMTLILEDAITGLVYTPKYSTTVQATDIVLSDDQSIETDQSVIPTCWGIFSYARSCNSLIEALKINIQKITEAVDGAGYTVVPFMTLRSAGRGVYGNNYHVIASSETAYEKTYGIKLYNFMIGTVKNGFVSSSIYTAAPVTAEKYTGTSMYINDLMEDIEPGNAPVIIKIDEEALTDVYEAYTEFCEQIHDNYAENEVTTSYAAMVAANNNYVREFNKFNGKYLILTETEIVNPNSDCRVPSWVNTEVALEEFNTELATVRDAYAKYIKARDNYLEVKRQYDAIVKNTLPTKDEFDWLFGKVCAGTDKIPFVNIVTDPTVDGEEIAAFDSAEGIALYGGHDGYFTNPRTVVSMVDGVTKSVKWTVEDEVNDCYKKAWNGTLDPLILTSKRIPVDAFFDANYALPVKVEMAKLACARASEMCYLDCGIMNRITLADLSALNDVYVGFSDRTLSKNLQAYTVRERSTNKRCLVTITYLLAQKFTNHILTVGRHIPMVETYCELTGHIKNSLVPVVEDYMTEIKDALVDYRINYFETISDNVYRRRTQTTAQIKETDLSEENNMLLLYQVKREIEEIFASGFYDFADGGVQSLLTKMVETKYEGWNSNYVDSISVTFSANEWEKNHKIIHCYLNMVFRPLFKRGILEIDINRYDSPIALTGVSSTDV